MGLYLLLIILNHPFFTANIYLDSFITKRVSSESVYCYIKKVYSKDEKIFIEADYIQFLTGKQAIEAAKKRGEAEYDINPKGDTTYFVFNDYYIINENKKLRELELDKQVKIKCYIIVDNSRIKANQTIEDLKSRVKFGVFIIELQNGAVQSITERYVP